MHALNFPEAQSLTWVDWVTGWNTLKAFDVQGDGERWWPEQVVANGSASKADCRADLSSSQQWENSPNGELCGMWGVASRWANGCSPETPVTAQSQGLGF